MWFYVAEEKFTFYLLYSKIWILEIFALTVNVCLLVVSKAKHTVASYNERYFRSKIVTVYEY
jgi:hypothetical protein